MTGTVAFVVTFLGKVSLGFFVHLDSDLFAFQQVIEFFNLAVNNLHQCIDAKRVELHNGIEPVSELRCEESVDRLVCFHGCIFVKAHDIGLFGAEIGGHNKHDVFEIAHHPVVVCQFRTVHDLQQNIHNIRMRLFDLVKQQYRMRMLLYHLCEQSALLVTDISRRSTYQAADSVCFHVLAHIDTLEMYMHRFSKLCRQCRFSYPGGTNKEEGADRSVLSVESGIGALDRRCQYPNGFILPDYVAFEIFFKVLELLRIVRAHHRGGQFHHLGDTLFNIFWLHSNILFAAQHEMCPYLIDNIHRFVRQETVMQIFYRKIDRTLQRFISKFDLVKILVLVLYPFENGKGVLDARFFYIYLGKTATERLVLVEEVSKLLIGRRTDTLDLPACKGRFEQIAGIHAPAACCTRTHHRMNFIYKKNCIFLLLELLENAFKPFFKITAVLRSGDQRTHIECKDLRIFKNVGYIPFADLQCQPFGNGGFAHARFTYQQRVVLFTSAECLHDTVDLINTSDDRVDLARFGKRYKLHCKLIEQCLLFVTFLRGCFRLSLCMRDHFKDVHPGNPLFFHQIDSIGVLLHKDGRKHITHFCFTASGGMNVCHHIVDGT